MLLAPVLMPVMLVSLLLLDAACFVLVVAVARSHSFSALLLLLLVLLAAAYFVLVVVAACCLLGVEEGNPAEVVSSHLWGAARPPWRPEEGGRPFSPAGARSPTWR